MGNNLIRGSGNVFADVGELNADKKLRKAMLAADIIKRLDAMNLCDATLSDLQNIRRANLESISKARLICIQSLLALFCRAAAMEKVEMMEKSDG